MAIADNFSVAANGDIRYTTFGGDPTYTVLELHRFLQDLADNASVTGDDILDITDQTPSDRATDNIITLINGYNIDDTASQKLYDGSITQAGGATVYSGLRVLGAVSNTNTELQIIQNNTVLTAFWGDQAAGGLNGDAASGVLMRCLIKSRDGGSDIDGKRIRVQARHWGDSYDFFNVTLGSGESVAAISTTPDAQNGTSQVTVTAYTHVANSGGYVTDAQDETTLTTFSGGGSHVISDIITLNDGTLVTVDNVATGAVTEFTVDTSGSVGAKAGQVLTQVSTDGSGTGFDLTIASGNLTNDTDAPWGGYQQIDLNNGNLDRDYYSGWTYGADTSGDGLKAVWEYTKDLTGTGTSKTIHGINGELFLGVTHSFDYDAESGSFAENEVISWGSGATAGTGLLLALDDNGADGVIYMQLLTGVVPSDNLTITGGTSTATCLVDGSASSKTIPKHFLGSYTGTLIGAYGIGVVSGNLTASDTLEDLLGATQIPPNNVTFTVSSVVSGEDYILVGPESGGTLDTAQLSLEASAYSGGETSVILSASIPTDTPASGTFRVFSSAIGTFVKVTYTGYSGSTFTGCSDMPAALASADVFISYIDKVATATSESVTVIYDADRALWVRVRDGGGTPIKTFETPSTLGNAGGSVAAIRTTDA
ncbi:hypothetical protein N9955_01075 [bacterium]|nr:hypothetical protein [bacterium]